MNTNLVGWVEERNPASATERWVKRPILQPVIPAKAGTQTGRMYSMLQRGQQVERRSYRFKTMMKQAYDLGPLDFAAHPVWEFAPENEGIDECSMVPVKSLPVEHLDQRCLGTQVTLADGSKVWVVFFDLWPHTLEGTIKSQKFRFFSGEKSRDWPDDEFQPETVNSSALAEFLARTVEDVFPFTYDVSHLVTGDMSVTKRSVPREEEDKKSWKEPIDPALFESFLKGLNP
jgi:hypothetical protein